MLVSDYALIGTLIGVAIVVLVIKYGVMRK